MQNIRVTEFKKKAEKALSLCNEELFLRKHNMSGEGTIEQFEDIIIPELEALLNLDLQNLPPKEERCILSYENAIRKWHWSMENTTTIFDLLEELYYEYKAF